MKGTRSNASPTHAPRNARIGHRTAPSPSIEFAFLAPPARSLTHSIVKIDSASQNSPLLSSPGHILGRCARHPTRCRHSCSHSRLPSPRSHLLISKSVAPTLPMTVRRFMYVFDYHYGYTLLRMSCACVNLKGESCLHR